MQQATKLSELNRVYPIGYSRNGAFVDQLMQDKNVLLIDTRKSPNSKVPGFSRSELEKAYGRRYRFAGQYLGNINHWKDNAPIEIANLTEGIKGLLYYLNKGHDLILLCGCPEYKYEADECHLKTIINALDQEMEVNVVTPSQLKSSLHICERGSMRKAAKEADKNCIKCISVRQPYATWLVNPNKFFNAQITPKCIENRDWTTSYRGPLLIHASKTFEDNAIAYWQQRCPWLGNAVSLEKQDYPLGCIVGIADLVDIVQESNDPWFCGDYGWVLANAMAFDNPVPYRGALKLFDVTVCHCCSMPVNDGNSSIIGDDDKKYRLCIDCIK
jgi:hypothetical protein